MAVRAYNDMSYVDLDVKCIIVLENKFVKNKCHNKTLNCYNLIIIC